MCACVRVLGYLDIQHTVRKPRTVTCGLLGPKIYFPVHKKNDFPLNKSCEIQTDCFVFLYKITETFLILTRFEQILIKN
jgi:hypothetical protein